MNIERIKEFALKNIVTIVAIAVSIISVVGSGVFLYMNQCEPCVECEEINTEILAIESPDEIVEARVKVDVKGAVKKPGVYELAENSTVNDAIILAGGLISSGVTTNINLSKKLSDEMVIYVFTKKELEEKETSNKLVCEIPKCECEEVKACDTVVDNTQSNDNTTNSTESNTKSKVSINTGTLEELMTLDGVGESKAKSIIDYRTTNGLFQNMEDIKNVSGIGDAAYEKIKDQIKL